MPRRKHAAEERQRHQRRDERERDRLDDLPDRPGRAELDADPENQRRRDHDVADRVTEPPRQPDARCVLRRHETAQRERGHTDGRGHRRADQRGEQREADDVADAIEHPSPARKPVDQVRREQPFDCIAHRDADGRENGAGGRDIREESTGEDRGPHPVAQEHEGGERDPGGWPDRGDRTVDVRESEAELRADIVDRGEAEQQRHAAYGLAHLAQSKRAIRHESPHPQCMQRGSREIT